MIEIELKLLADESFSAEALLAALEGQVEVGPSLLLTVRDVYFDTRARSLARAGLSARWRRKGRKSSLQLKPVLLLPDQVLCRTELSVRLARDEEPGLALRRLVERSLPIKLRGTPVPEVELRSRREVRQLRTPEGCTAELSLDRSTALLPGVRRGPSFVEVELEHQQGSLQAFAALCERLTKVPGLSASRQSKHYRALSLLERPLGLQAPPAPSFGPQTPVDQVARLIGAQQLQLIEAYEAGARVGLDPEYLHKMRVATRRLRAALVVFRGCFDRRSEDQLQRGLRWLAAALGEVRDLDVQLLQLAEREQALGPEPAEGWRAFYEVLEGQREARRRELLQLLDSQRYQQLLARGARVFAGAAPRRRAGHPGQLAVALWAQDILARRIDKLRGAARKCQKAPHPERLHALRIRGKKLRYAAEFFAPLYGEGFRKRVKQLSGFQDVLGLFQDGVVLGELARRLRDEALASGQDGAYLYVLGQLEATSQAEAAAGQQQLGQALEQAGGLRAIKRLKKKPRQLAQRLQALGTDPAGQPQAAT